MDLILLAHAQQLELQATSSQALEEQEKDPPLDYHAVDEDHKCLMVENFSNYTTRCRYNYSRIDHFKKCMDCYQGTQLSTVPDEVYEALQDTEVTRENILRCLKKLKLTKHYKDVHMIYFDLSGTKIDDIDYLEDRLIRDFINFVRVYDALKVDRKNFLSFQYVLYQLLRRRGHPCDEKNFNLPMTERSRRLHDEICLKVFNELGWEYITS